MYFQIVISRITAKNVPNKKLQQKLDSSLPALPLRSVTVKFS